MVNGEPVLEIERLVKLFSGVRALDGLDLTVASGEPVAVLGPNGSGKTTLFNVVSGFMVPDGGSVRLRGRRIESQPAHQITRLGLTRTFQQASAFANQTVRANIQLAALGKSGLRRQSVASHGGPVLDGDHVLEVCRLTHVAEKVASALPHGERRKLGVAIGLATSPAVLLLDEPAAGLGDEESADLGKTISAIGGMGVTTVIIDHDMSFVLPIVDRVAVLNAGRKIWEGAPEGVKSAAEVREVYFGSDDE